MRKMHAETGCVNLALNLCTNDFKNSFNKRTIMNKIVLVQR